jgi:organic radical activating enzyme
MPKNNNETDLQYKRRVIDIKSESFCGAKWYNATIWLGSGMTTSCHHPLPHKVDVEDVVRNPKALHNTQRKKMEREQMQRGERPAGCEYCWKIEDIGRDNISDRVYKTVIYQDEELAHAFRTPASQDIDLKTLEIAFDRTCQFACSYCNPAFSSTWVNDIRKNGPYAGLVSDGRNHFTHTHDSSQLYKFGESNPYVEAFHQWWESDLYQTLDELRITGGEPLMSGETWKLIEWFKANKGKSKTRLAINSNLGAQVDLDKLMTALDDIQIDLYTSNESVGLQSEYIRDGLNWDAWANNVEKLLNSKKLRGLHVMMTISALSLESLPQMLDVIMQWKQEHGKEAIDFSVNIMRFPSFQSALVLPDDLRQKYMFKLHDWLDENGDNEFLHDREYDQLCRLKDYLDVVKTPHMGAAERDVLEKDFKQFFDQYDIRRNKDFSTTFPSLADWYKNI